MTFEEHDRASESGPAEGTGDYLVPIGTTEDGCCKLSSFNSLQPRNPDDRPASMPSILPVNTVLSVDVGGKAMVAVGCAPGGIVALLDARDWAYLQRWKFTRLRVGSGKVRACGKGNSVVADRFLLNASLNHIVFHRNGNPLDLRRSNLVAISRKLLLQADVEKARPADYHDVDFQMRDGRWRSRRKPLSLSAQDRVAALMAGS